MDGVTTALVLGPSVVVIALIITALVLMFRRDVNEFLAHSGTTTVS